MVSSVSAERRAIWEVTSAWWVFLVTGVLWLLVALVVLGFDATSLATVDTGILEVLLAFLVSQQFSAPRAALIILWIGFSAMFRGMSEISLAFEMRGVGRAMGVS